MTEIPKDRPVFLLVLCILSFTWMGLSVLTGAGQLVLGPSSDQEMAVSLKAMDKTIDELESKQMESWKPTFEKFKIMTIRSNENFYGIGISGLLITILGIFSVIMMLKGNKNGFHIYIGYSLLSAASYYFFISPSVIPTFLIIISLLLSGIFVAMYAVNLKWMR